MKHSIFANSCLLLILSFGYAASADAQLQGDIPLEQNPLIVSPFHGVDVDSSVYDVDIDSSTYNSPIHEVDIESYEVGIDLPRTNSRGALIGFQCNPSENYDDEAVLSVESMAYHEKNIELITTYLDDVDMENYLNAQPITECALFIYRKSVYEQLEGSL